MRWTIRYASLGVPLVAVLLPGLAPADPQNVPLCTAGGDQTLAACGPDGQGGVLAVWLDRRSGADLDVYVRRATANGEPADGWPENGAPACVASLEKVLATCGFDVVDMVPVRRQNLDMKCEALKVVGRWFAESKRAQ